MVKHKHLHNSLTMKIPWLPSIDSNQFWIRINQLLFSKLLFWKINNSLTTWTIFGRCTNEVGLVKLLPLMFQVHDVFKLCIVLWKGNNTFAATEGPKETEVAVLDNMVDPNATETSTMTTRSRIIVCPKGRCFWPISLKLVMETLKICFYCIQFTSHDFRSKNSVLSNR